MTQSGGRMMGRVAIVSGGAKGLGAGQVRLLAREGAKVAIGDIDDAAGAALAKEIGDAAIFVHLDVTRAGDWANIVATTEKAFGLITTLVNNAGIIVLAKVDELTEEQYRRIIDVNQIGPLLGMQAVIPSMRKLGGGSIINVASAAGISALPALGAYSSTKFALRGLTKSASLDLAADNIRVNALCPGSSATTMTEGVPPPKHQAIKRFGQPNEIAAMALFLASDEASYCTGGDYVVDGGFLNLVGEVLI